MRSESSLSARLQRLVPGLALLSAGLVAAVDAEALVFERAAGSTLFDDGHPCAGMLLLECGALRVTLASEAGRSLMLYRVQPGETCVLTLSCLLGHDRYPARGEAESAVRGLILPPPLFDRLVRDETAFREFVFHAFATRLRGALAIASALAFEPLDRRLAGLLLERAQRALGPELPVTHQQLADELGCSREAASRLLEGLAESGVLTLGRGLVRVIDRPTLVRLAGCS